jgi:LacI family transcriptional regulator
VAKRPTLKDVSEAASVSTFTASRALTGGSGISETTRRHVRQVAQKLGYIPNQLARGLKGGSTRTIGVLTANTNNLYYATLTTAIERRLQVDGYHSIVMDAVLDGEYRPEREDAFIEDLLQHQVAAVVLTYAISPTHIETLASHNVPLVFVDAQPPRGFDNYVSVNSDNYAGARSLGEHLAEHEVGRDWLFVGFTSSWTSREPRQRGFVDAATAYGARVEVVEGGNDSETAYEACSADFAARIAEGRPLPDVLFAGNELLLQGSLKAARQTGVRIPEQMAVVSYDEFEWANYVDPAITLVDQRVPELGRIVADQLLNQLTPRGSGVPSGQRIILPSTLIVRRSCGCPETRGPATATDTHASTAVSPQIRVAPDHTKE